MFEPELRILYEIVVVACGCWVVVHAIDLVAKIVERRQPKRE